jgi:hypothetical protein
MTENNDSNYITSTKSMIIGNKKRSVFIIKPNSNKNKSSNTAKVNNMFIKKARKCSGCSRNRNK